jgi:hypothetical protein
MALPIIAPGVLDVVPNARDPFAIGYHARTLEMKAGTQGNVNIFDNTDAAIFEIRNPDLVSSMQGTVFDTPAEVAAPVDGMSVEKVGRTTGYTKGTIVGRELMPIRVTVAAPQYQFQALVYFANAYIIHGEADMFSDGGDSGSLVVHAKADGTREAVGLIFAGGPDSKAPGNVRSFMLPLEPILARLGVTLVTGHHVP